VNEIEVVKQRLQIEILRGSAGFVMSCICLSIGSYDYDRMYDTSLDFYGQHSTRLASNPKPTPPACVFCTHVETALA